MEKYDRSTDPNEHITVYTTQISLYTWNDVILCRVFPTTLKGAALSWFTRLPPLSINCFDTLVQKFGACHKPTTSFNINCFGKYKVEKGRIIEAIHGALWKGGAKYS